MTRPINIPLLFILIFLISKEIFSYEGEKIVILCILCFAITAYYNLRTVIYDSFLSISSKIEEELVQLLNLKIKLEKDIKSFWELFLDLENLLVEIYFWVKVNFQNYIKKANKNRILFNFHIVKDQLNSIVKETVVTQYLFKALQKAITINNFYFMLDSNINASPLTLDISSFFNKLKQSDNDYTFDELVINKLDINRQAVVNNNNYNINTLLLLNIKF